MRRNIVFSGVILLLFIGFCVQAQQNTAGKPVVPVAEILKDVRSWVGYDATHLRLTGDFMAYNAQASAIGKGEFLKQLSSGNYLPVKLTSKDGMLSYQLFKIPAENSLQDVIEDYGRRLYHQYNREGKALPAFSFKDLNAFLKKTKFSYAVVPDQHNYMSGAPGINIYPTHFIINKKGVIVKEVTDAEDMIRALNKVL